jgi:hypothetical protein
MGLKRDKSREKKHEYKNRISESRRKHLLIGKRGVAIARRGWNEEMGPRA